MSESADDITELLQRGKEGDEAARQDLLQRCRPFVQLLVRARLGARLRVRLDSSDVVQEVLLRVAGHLQEFRGGGAPEWRAWLTRIAEREVVRQFRLHLGTGKRTAEKEQEAGQSRLESWFRTHSSPSLAARQEEDALALAQALERLPEDHREVLVLRHLEGLGFPEIAQRLDRSAGAVRVLWTRALKNLREEMRSLGMLDSTAEKSS